MNIEFYKNRNLGDRFSASAEFIRENGLTLFKHIFIPALPLVILQAYFTTRYVGMAAAIADNPENVAAFGGSVLLLFLFTILLALYIPSMAGALMSRYEAGLLTKETTFKDLSGKMFSNMGKYFVIGLLIGLLVGGAAIILSLLMVLFAGISVVITVIFGILLFFALLAILPPLALAYFPAFFQEAGAGESLKKGISLGFKNWGTTLATILIAGIMTIVFYVVFAVPYYVWIAFEGLSGSGIITYLLTLLTSMSTLFVTPLTFVFLAFQYFSIVEKEEGISLQSKVDEFDNL